MPLPKKRLDTFMVEKGLVMTRSQAQNLIKLGKVFVDKQPVKKAGYTVSGAEVVEVRSETYVSRAAFKLASVADIFRLDFTGKRMLDVGSSTGGFTDFALQHGARQVVAVDVGTDQLHPTLRVDERVEVHEKTDIRDFARDYKGEPFGLIVVDVSFISQRKLFNSLKKVAGKNTLIVSMAKPQFEGKRQQLRNGVVKNERTRRDILQNFEYDLKQSFLLRAKADSKVSGQKGNTERFYLLQKLLPSPKNR